MESSEAVEYLQERIRAYEFSLAKLKAQIDTWETEVIRTEALLNSAKSLLRDELGGSSGLPSEQQIERLSILPFSEAIEEIINSYEGPIHADQIMKKLRDGGKISKAKNPKNSIVSLLHRGVNSGQYKKVGPNLYESMK